MTVRELIAKILFRTDATGLKKVETNTAAAKRQMRAASRAAWSLKKDLRGIAVGFKTVVAAVVAGRVAKLFTADFAKSTDEAIKFSKALGISLESYLGLTHAVRLSGGDVADMQKALGQLSKRALEVKQGNKTMAKAFDDVGVKVTDSRGELKATDVLLLEMADRFKGMKSEAERTGLAMQLFGRTGIKLIPMFLEGADGINKMMEEAKSLGIVLSKDQAAIAENYNDEMLRATSVLTGVRNVIALRVLPAINKNIRAFQLWAREGDNLKRMVDNLIIGAKALAVAFGLVAAVKFGQTMGVLVAVTKKAVFWTKLQARATLMAYAPYLAVGLAVAAIVLAIQDLYVYSKGGTSAVGRLLEKFAPAEKIRAVLNKIGASVRQLGQEALELGRSAIPVVVSALRRLIPIGAKIIKVWLEIQKTLYKAARILWKEFGPVLTELGVALLDLFEELWPVIEDGARAALGAAQVLGSELLLLWRAVWPEVKALAKGAHELLKSLIDELKSAWREVKPAVMDIVAALGDLWVVAKPILKKIIAGALTISKEFFGLVKKALPALSAQFKTTFKAIALVIKSAIIQLTTMVRLVTTVIRGIKAAYNSMLELLGLQGKTELGAALKKAGIAPVPGAAPTARAGAPFRGGPQTNNLSVGSLGVTIQGTTGMTAEEIAAAVAAGTRKALQDAVEETFTSFRPAWL